MDIETSVDGGGGVVSNVNRENTYAFCCDSDSDGFGGSLVPYAVGGTDGERRRRTAGRTRAPDEGGRVFDTRLDVCAFCTVGVRFATDDVRQPSRRRR